MSLWKREVPVLTHSETKEAIRQERGKLAVNIIDLETRRHHLEELMLTMIRETHKGRGIDDPV